ncbi:MAG: hypothetical protein O9302_05180 [Cyclobacteriaceae bacterium]|nr:hypothetical protein [Cytophagales bacterium]MCZ8327429.1 hypothetical protein [Cyclobacteriaceae bacterium]
MQNAWQIFAEKRKQHQIDYFLLSQPFEKNGNQIIVPLANPVQETMLNEFRTDLITHLRESLQNYSINVIGELRLPDEKKMVYTNKDKLAFLIDKNPAIAELKDKLGLDPDY